MKVEMEEEQGDEEEKPERKRGWERDGNGARLTH